MNSVLNRCRLLYFCGFKRCDKPTLAGLRYSHVLSRCDHPPSSDFIQSITTATTKVAPCQTWPRRLLSTPDISTKLKSCGSLSSDILCLTTCEDVMKYLESVSADSLTEDHVWLGLDHIFQLQYNALWERNTCLHANVHIAYIQLFLQGKLTEYMKPIFDHEYFPVLYKHLTDNFDTIDIDKVADILQILIYLGMSPEDIVITKFLMRISNEIHLLSLNSLVTLSHVLRSLPGLNFDIIKQVLKRLKDFTQSTDSPSAYEVYCVSKAAGNMMKFITKDTIESFMLWHEKVLADLHFEGCPEYIGTILRFLQTCVQFHPQSHSETWTSIDVLQKECLQHIRSFDCLSMFEVCRALKLMRKYTTPLKEVMEQRACELLNQDTRIVDICNLMGTLSKTTDRSIVRKFENYILSRMSDPNVQMDSILLSGMTDSLLDFPRKNSDILALFHKCAADHSETIIAYITRFNRVERLLLRYPFKCPDDEKRFINTVVKYIDGSHGASLMTLTCLGGYLLSCENYDLIPNHIYLRLISSMSNWNTIALGKLINNLSFVVDTCSNDKKQHFIELLGRVQQVLSQKLKDVSSGENLFLATLPIMANPRLLNPSLSQRIMDLYIPLSEESNSENARKMAKFFAMSNFRIPQVFENLVNNVVGSSQFSSEINFQTLQACSRSNYIPAKMDEFCDIIKSTFSREFDAKQYKVCLKILNSLAVFKIYPKDELLKFFSLDVIQDLEKIIDETHNKVLEQELMNLNRNVVVECPDLNIPWFHEQYCQDLTSLKRGINRNKESLLEDIHSNLISMMGSSKYIRRQSLSPFFHKIDFECALDTRNKPLSVNDLGKRQSQKFQRVAICVHPELAFCRNSRVLNGSEELRKRQLETLNYRIVEVPFFEWFSMGLTEKSSKIKYLEDKIFKNV